MQKQEAFKILGCDESTSEDDVKKKYRDLCKRFHPDVNKDPGATDQFKKINEAYQTYQAPEPTSQFDVFNGGQGFPQNFDLGDLFSSFSRNFNPIKTAQQINVPIKVTFEESILGLQREIKYVRYMKCEPCNGVGSTIAKDKSVCEQCKGSGQEQQRSGNMIFSRPCSKCMGRRANHDECVSCSGEGSVATDVSLTVSIPEGVENGNTLRLSGAGNYQKVQSRDFYLDAYITVSVLNHQVFKRENNDVVSDITISLLDALQGCTRKMLTVHGEASVDIPAMTKNKDQAILSTYGIKSRNGHHRFIINVDYPSDSKILIDTLKTLEK